MASVLAVIRELLKELAKYEATPPTLSDGEAHNLTLTSDGKLRVDDPTTQTKIDDVEEKLDHASHGLAALKTLIDAVETKLDHASHGLAALKTLIDAVETKLDSPGNFKADVSTAEGKIDDVEAKLDHATYGLSALNDHVISPKKYVIGDAVLHSHDAEVEVADESYTKQKTITLSVLVVSPGTIRVSFDGKRNVNSLAYARVYKNGAAVGTERTLTTSYVSYSEDFSFAQGDTVELWAYTQAAAYTCHVKNFRVLGTETRQTAYDPFQAANS